MQRDLPNMRVALPRFSCFKGNDHDMAESAKEASEYINDRILAGDIVTDDDLAKILVRHGFTLSEERKPRLDFRYYKWRLY